MKFKPTRIYDRDKVYNFIVDFKAANDGLSPSIREIGRRFRITSTSVVDKILTDLEVQGLIKRDYAVARGIKVIGGQWMPPGRE